MAGIKITQARPGGAGRRYGSFTGRPAITTVPTPTIETLATILERIGGAKVHTLFDLTVTHPIPHTWHLAVVPVNTPPEGLFDPGTFAPDTLVTGLGGTIYTALVKEHSGVGTFASLGGVGGDGGVTLTLINALGTGDGPGRKFMDAFATNVPGYSEPYDLLTATLQARLYSELLPGDPLIIGGALALFPNGYEWVRGSATEPEVVHLTFGPDQRRYIRLPVKTITTRRYAHAPDGALNQPIVPWFAPATGLRVPCIQLDPDGGLFLVGASPAETPLGGVTKLWTLHADPDAEKATPVAQEVQLTTAGQVLLSIPATASGNEVLKAAAQRLEIGPAGAFVYGVRLWIKKALATAPLGSLSIAVVLDQDGLPGTVLVDQAATAEVNAAIVTTTGYLPYDIPFHGNDPTPRATFMPGNRGVWVVVKYAKDPGGGDLHLNTDTSGGYADGILATQDSATQEEWLLSGKQTRRGPVRQDYTGGGTLVQSVATGVITLKAPVTVPGL